MLDEKMMKNKDYQAGNTQQAAPMLNEILAWGARGSEFESRRPDQ
jgi:hypothetical protein